MHDFTLSAVSSLPTFNFRTEATCPTGMVLIGRASVKRVRVRASIRDQREPSIEVE
jgi:hypothetical protein